MPSARQKQGSIPYPHAHRRPDGIAISFSPVGEDKLAMFRLRYEVFAEELGRSIHADFPSRTYRDSIDDGNTHTLKATTDQGIVVGTLRLTLRREQMFLEDEAYQISKLHTLVGRSRPIDFEQVALADRGAIRKDFRGTTVYDDMWHFLFSYCQSLDISVVLGVLDSSNAALNRYHQRRGWQTYRLAVPYKDLIGNFILYDLRESTQQRASIRPLHAKIEI